MEQVAAFLATNRAPPAVAAAPAPPRAAAGGRLARRLDAGGLGHFPHLRPRTVAAGDGADEVQRRRTTCRSRRAVRPLRTRHPAAAIALATAVLAEIPASASLGVAPPDVTEIPGQATRARAHHIASLAASLL